MLFSTGLSLLRRLQPHIPTLLDAMSYKIHDLLVDEKLFRVADLKKILDEKTTRAQNRKLYEILLKKSHRPSCVIDAICKGLCDSSQYCPFATKEKKLEPVTEDQHDMLGVLRKRLVDDMDVTAVVDRLHEKGIVDEHVREEICASRTRRERIDVLLCFIYRTHRKAFDDFMDILHRLHPWIFDDK